MTKFGGDLLKHKTEFTDIGRSSVTPHYSKTFYGVSKNTYCKQSVETNFSSINSPLSALSKFLFKTIAALAENTYSQLN